MFLVMMFQVIEYHEEVNAYINVYINVIINIDMNKSYLITCLRGFSISPTTRSILTVSSVKRATCENIFILQDIIMKMRI